MGTTRTMWEDMFFSNPPRGPRLWWGLLHCLLGLHCWVGVLHDFYDVCGIQYFQGDLTCCHCGRKERHTI